MLARTPTAARRPAKFSTDHDVCSAMAALDRLSAAYMGLFVAWNDVPDDRDDVLDLAVLDCAITAVVEFEAALTAHDDAWGDPSQDIEDHRALCCQSLGHRIGLGMLCTEPADLLSALCTRRRDLDVILDAREAEPSIASDNRLTASDLGVGAHGSRW